MQHYLNLAIIQMPIKRDARENIKYLKEKISRLVNDKRKPELVVGVEFGIAPSIPEPQDGTVMESLSAMAGEFGIYLIPGTMKLSDGREGFYNAAPIFSPRGDLIATYAKMVPWNTGLEEGTIPGQEYRVFEIPEKNTRVGVQICFDADFPEISRTQTLLGAEILVQLSMDPDSIPLHYNAIKVARAIENQAYYVYTNGVGDYDNFHLRGHSMVIDPEGNILYEAGEAPTFPVITIDINKVRQCREAGNWNQVSILKTLGRYRPRQPYAGRELESPLFKKFLKP